MREIRSTTRYRRRLEAFLDKHPDLEVPIELMVDRIAAGSVRVHPLHGSLRGFHAARISQSYRLVFALEPDAVIFIDIGAHDDVY